MSVSLVRREKSVDAGCDKHGFQLSKTSYFVCGTSVSSWSKGQVNIWDVIPLHIFLDKRYNTLVLSVISNLPKGQVELRVGQGKEKTHLSTGQVHLNLFLLPLKPFLH